jgi:predicted nucleic acid-binding protein
VITADSSVVIAAATSWHVAHDVAVRALEGAEAALVAHVAYETTAALSRMPEGHRVAAEVVLVWLEQRFKGEWLSLPSQAAHRALRTAVEQGIRGGALYDALVGATAAHHRRVLLTADRRAAPVYRALGATVEYLGEP